jgi:tRNA threonylcarbamoyladenosine biosynthesis protein TsaE
LSPAPHGLRPAKLHEKWGLNVGRVANLRPIVNRPSDGSPDASTIFSNICGSFKSTGGIANPHAKADWQSAGGWQPAPHQIMHLSEVTHSEEETIQLGRRIARELPRRAVVLLIGNLGAGKTTLAKGIVSGLGAATPEDVSSPTFTLIHEYGDGRVYHVDLYRLERAEELATLGLDEIFDRDAVVLIEWGERFPTLLPEERIEIRLRALGGDTREIIANF